MAYVSMLGEFAERRTLTLREMQQAAGRMQRAILTLPWHQRRVSRATRRDFAGLKELLELNLGKGYYTFDHFTRALAVYTDASKSSRYAGGGYFSMCGRFRWWIYGTAASKRLIDELEGDSFLVALEDLGSLWRKQVVPVHIDNLSLIHI